MWSKFLRLTPTVNRVIKFFIICDLFLWTGWGFIDPFFSVFVIRNIAGATIFSVGLLATIYWITKAAVQIPVSFVLDHHPGEKDDFYALVFGLMVISLSSFSFMIAQTIHQVYFIQFIKAVGFAMYIPAWSSIFSRHMDKEYVAMEWAIDSSSVSFGIGLAGLAGGSIAGMAGFNFVFLLVGLFALLSAAVLLFAPDLILPRKTIMKPQTLDHVQVGIK